LVGTVGTAGAEKKNGTGIETDGETEIEGEGEVRGENVMNACEANVGRMKRGKRLTRRSKSVNSRVRRRRKNILRKRFQGESKQKSRAESSSKWMHTRVAQRSELWLSTSNDKSER
jgi:hypothetical protein